MERKGNRSIVFRYLNETGRSGTGCSMLLWWAHPTVLWS